MSPLDGCYHYCFFMDSSDSQGGRKSDGCRKSDDCRKSGTAAVIKSQLSSCKPRTHFAMLKIEKTGSSTLYTILARFVREHN